LIVTPKALANSSPRLERSDNLGYAKEIPFNPEGVNVAGITLSALIHICGSVPGLSRRSNPGLTLANAFGVICGFVPGLSRRSNPGLTLANAFGVICGSVPRLSLLD
jgi:hypothetical protein